MDCNTAQKLLEEGYVAIVYAAYDYADKRRGDVISKHKTYEAANRQANGNILLEVRQLSEIVAGPKPWVFIRA